MKVSEWFPDFVSGHMARCPREDWPQLGTDDGNLFWDAIRSNLIRIGATAEHASEASTRVAGDPPRWLNEHPKAILDGVKAVRDESAGHGQAGPFDDREAAREASRGCLDCGGEGLATRHRHVTPGPREARVVVFLCLCPMGRWMLARQGEKPAILDLKARPDLWLAPVPWSDRPDNRYRHPAEAWNAADDRPIDLETFQRSLEASEDGGRDIYRGARHEPARGQARALPGRVDQASPIPDPVLEREKRRREAARSLPPAPPDDLTLPEDDLNGWF